MPTVFDKININKDSIPWDFNKYQPDLVIVELGQNDGLQDITTFCRSYIKFRSLYPKATIALLNSPMADNTLKSFLDRSTISINQLLDAEGEKNIMSYSFKKQYIAGCDNHPSLEEHTEIAKELISFLRKELKWKS